MNNEEEREYDFAITGMVRGTFYATQDGMKKFMNMIFNSPNEGFCCEVVKDED